MTSSPGEIRKFLERDISISISRDELKGIIPDRRKRRKGT